MSKLKAGPVVSAEGWGEYEEFRRLHTDKAILEKYKKTIPGQGRLLIQFFGMVRKRGVYVNSDDKFERFMVEIARVICSADNRYKPGDWVKLPNILTAFIPDPEREEIIKHNQQYAEKKKVPHQYLMDQWLEDYAYFANPFDKSKYDNLLLIDSYKVEAEIDPDLILNAEKKVDLLVEDNKLIL